MDESITVERVRHALVVGRLDTDGAAVLLAANLPARREKTFVVVGDSSVDAMTRLDPWVTADLADAIHGDVCVVAPRFGSMGRDGTLPPARLLADRLGVEVTAADGEPVGLADGTVFVPGPTAGWVSFRPGGQRVRVGARLPAPWWQEGLPAPGPHVTHVPAGLWVRREDAPPRPDDPLLARVPDLDRMYVVLGAPGELPPSRETVTTVLRGLPDESRDRAVLAWYGSGVMAPAMAAAIAADLDTPVRVGHGVPGDGGLVYVDEQGAARWRPFAVESVYRPGREPVLDRWTAPPSLALAAPGSFRLTAGWVVDVVASGLVVRPESRQVQAAAVSPRTGPTADIVFATEGPVPPEVLTRLDDLIRDLPADTREVVRLLPVDKPAEEALAGISVADRVVPAEQPVMKAEPAPGEVPPPAGAVVVTADGRILPAAPIVGRSAPAADSVAAPDVETTVVMPAVAVPATESTTELPAVLASSLLTVPARNGAAYLATVATEEAPTPEARPRPATPEVARDVEAVSTVDIQNGVLVIDLEDADPEPQFAATSSPEDDKAAAIPSVAAASSAPVSGEGGAQARPLASAASAQSAGPVQPAAPVLRPAAAPQPAVGRAEPAQPASAADPAPQPVAAVTQSVPDAQPAWPTQSGDLGQPAAQAPAMPQAAPLPRVTPVAGANAAATVASVAALLPKRESIPAKTNAPIEIPENVRSTAAQRRSMRTRLGSRYDVATRAVTRLLSERPGLRFGAGDHAALLAELAVVRVFADDPAGDYDADFYVCLADGLRRLPTARTVVVRGIPAGADVQPDAVLRLPTPLVAAAIDTPAVGPAEALIWTTTARRLDGLVDAPPEPEDDEAPPPQKPDVVLSGHTRLRVLAVERTPVPRILLAEDGAAPEAALTRLRAAAAARAIPEQPPATSRWFGPLPAAG